MNRIARTAFATVAGTVFLSAPARSETDPVEQGRCLGAVEAMKDYFAGLPPTDDIQKAYAGMADDDFKKLEPAVKSDDAKKAAGDEKESWTARLHAKGKPDPDAIDALFNKIDSCADLLPNEGE